MKTFLFLFKDEKSPDYVPKKRPKLLLKEQIINKIEEMTKKRKNLMKRCWTCFKKRMKEHKAEKKGPKENLSC